MESWFKKFTAFVSRNHQTVGITAVFLIVALGVVMMLNGWGIKLGPQDIRTFWPPLTVNFKISDHHSSTEGLANNLTDPTPPTYNDNPILTIPKDSGGNLPNLFRIQGEVEYK